MIVHKNKKRSYLVTFDMDTNAMSELFGETKYRRAYKIIENYFKEYDFFHDQHSVYITSKPIIKSKLNSIVENFCHEYPYIGICIEKISYSLAPKQHDITMFAHEGSSKMITQINETYSKEITTKDMFTPISQWEKDPTDNL